MATVPAVLSMSGTICILSLTVLVSVQKKQTQQPAFITLDKCCSHCNFQLCACSLFHLESRSEEKNVETDIIEYAEGSSTKKLGRLDVGKVSKKNLHMAPKYKVTMHCSLNHTTHDRQMSKVSNADNMFT